MAARLLSRRLTTTAAVNVRRVFACNAVRPWSFTARPDHIFPHGVRTFKSNITPSIQEKVGRNLHLIENHPIEIIKGKIQNYFLNKYVDPSTKESLFRTFDKMSPRVTTKACFDDMLVEPNHVSRRPTDTFYYTNDECLRTHTSAHQSEFLRAGHMAFLATGDCYRRDEIDASHYPVFHQMEGVRVWEADEGITTEFVTQDLKDALEGMVEVIFGKVTMRWVDAYFPFTDPSFELEVYYNGDWLEVLGSGMIQARILDNCGLASKRGWAFGIGLERLAMVLFKVPDIRLFWSEDQRFLSQFQSGQVVEFQPYSKYPPTSRDVAMWLQDEDTIHVNDFCAVVRDVAGDLVENVTLVDEFVHPKTQRLSRCFRVTYRAWDTTLTNDEVNVMHNKIRDIFAAKEEVELR